MSAADSAAGPRVASPCIRHCTLDDDDICLGCLRSIDDICAWGGADDEERLRILERATARRNVRSANDD